MLLDDCYIAYVNLAHRTDRRERMEKELERVGIKAERFDAIRTRDHQWDHNKWGTMLRRTPGACGCYASQMGVMQKALSVNKHAFVMEDDLDICSDFHERIEYFEKYLDGKNWDIIWLGATVHIGPPHWYTGHNPLLPGIDLGRDADRTDDPRILRTLACFCTYAYIVNKNSIEQVLGTLESQIPTSIGIDYSMIRMQPMLKTYCLLPGAVKQIDNLSDIGTGITRFSGFSKLNGSIENSRYWWQDKITDFDPATFNFVECK